jgi:phospholipid/cholesterol/gamma-HCH transport system ATP-binding protein
MESTRTPACRLTDVTVRHGDTTILSNVTIDFPGDACTVIMGPSGSGKTSLLKAAAGLLMPDGGRVEILGIDPWNASDRELESLRARNGFVFQDSGLWQNLSLYQNLALPLQYHRLEPDASAVRRRIERIAGELGATHRLDLRPSQVSEGEQKIVSFVRAIIGDPELLFMDEPSTSVDTDGIGRLVRRLKDLRARHKTVIAVTHDARIASQIADHIAVLKRGRLLRFGTLRDISRSDDPEVQRILTDVLSETATYDGDILDLLDPGQYPLTDDS